MAKIKSWGNLGASESHAQRTRETPNADREGRESNRQLIGTGEHLIGLVRERIGEQTIRKNAVLCVDMFLGASPEYFRPTRPELAGEYEPERLEKWVDANQGCFILQKPHSAMSISLTCSTSNKAFAALDSHLHPMQS
ncbi:MAG: plasmid recombination protein [Aphanocapsa lilacina HA4352-LM1]|nr:plasmid recombination protein [Aphanocapsa lilacina HA4352-LM1]